MKFFILSKKENFNHDLINDTNLSSIKATSLISNNFFKKDLGQFLVYIYTYNQIYEESENKFFKLGSSEISLLNGLASIEGVDDLNDMDKIFDSISQNKEILGDFQAVKLNENGDGIFKTTPSSTYPIFYYEDEYCSILSNELKLIVDGVELFNNSKFVDHYDFDYIHDLFFFNDDKKTSLRNTIFKNIKRIFPHDEISINNGVISVKENKEISVPEWFEDMYMKDRDEFYDWYYETFMDYANSLLNLIEDGVDTVKIPITGGFDSRLALMAFSKLAPKHNLKIISHTNGSSKHPDVIIGKRVADLLNVEWNQFGNDENDGKTIYRYLPQHLSEYATTFYASQGDFNSYDYIIYNREIENLCEFMQLGLDMYKRETIYSLIKSNRWSSRRRLFQTDFFFPLFSTSYELYIAYLNNKYYPGENRYKEFIYNVIKRCEPELLEIPFAYDYLPQTDVGEFKSEGYTSTLHKVKPFLWDYNFVLNELNPVLKPQFDKKDKDFNHILSKSGINPLDYFILEEEIDRLLDNISDCDDIAMKIKLMELKENAFYPKTRAFFDLNESKRYYREWSLLKLLDFAAAASFNSFVELEKASSFSDMENDILDVKEEIYKQIAEHDSNSLMTDYKNTLIRLDKSQKLNDEVLSSKSWKVTKPLRSFKKGFKK